MEVTDIRRILEDALPVRVPRFDPNHAPGPKIGALEDYMGLTAWHRGQLEEALHWLLEAEKALRLQWDEIEGWEQFVTTPRSSRTLKDEEAARALCRPDLSKGLKDAKDLKESLGRQIRRLERDNDTVSRQYTLLTGG